MRNAIDIPNINAGYRYLFNTYGRNIPMYGRQYLVEASSIKDALCSARKRVTNAWSFELVSTERWTGNKWSKI